MSRPITVVFDIDGVLADGTSEEVYSDEAGWNYSKCTPMHQGIKLLKHLKEKGSRIVLHTARWEKDKDVTYFWLKRHGIPFDELIMGKPGAELYIDDKGFHWEDLPDIIMDAVRGKEIEAYVFKNREIKYTEGSDG